MTKHDDTAPEPIGRDDAHDPAAAAEAERRLRGGVAGRNDDEAQVPDDEHDPAAAREAERRLRGGTPG